MTPPGPAVSVPDTTASPRADRHASWLELFFDLVAVAGVAQLAHLIHAPLTLAHFGVYLACLLAFWTAWMAFTVYGNISGDDTRTVTVVAGMFGLALMAAAAPGVFDTRAHVFALSYLSVRVLGARIWRDRVPRSSFRVVPDWPLAQMGFGLAPWLISMWTPDPVRYWLWGLGVCIDLVVIVAATRERVIAVAERRFATGARRTDSTRPLPKPVPKAVLFRVEIEHFGERLGLFVIIVLGETVLRATQALSAIEVWTGAVYLTVVGVFVLLAAIWAMNLPGGFAGIALLRHEAVGPRTVLLLHCATAVTLVTLADGIGAVLESVPNADLERPDRWLLCGAVAALSVLGACAEFLSNRKIRRLTLPILAGTVLPVALGGLYDHVEPVLLVWLLAAALLVQAVGLAPAGFLFRKIGARTKQEEYQE